MQLLSDEFPSLNLFIVAVPFWMSFDHMKYFQSIQRQSLFVRQSKWLGIFAGFPMRINSNWADWFHNRFHPMHLWFDHKDHKPKTIKSMTSKMLKLQWLEGQRCWHSGGETEKHRIFFKNNIGKSSEWKYITFPNTPNMEKTNGNTLQITTI